ncbi:MAG: hypothetical protein FD169_1204 [Bacillota bacterium]|nr:MAG: hypothetical protein FD169_1204 [Bacillota bacterium]
MNVAPPAGAWIETLYFVYLILKPLVAPPAGAWIETAMPVICLSRNTSHPLRVRELKLKPLHSIALAGQSHPLRVRGLKHQLRYRREALHQVAPPAGAWIETNCSGGTTTAGLVAPPAGAWIETLS